MSDSKPIVEITYDERMGGPIICDVCDTELDAVILTDDIHLLCTECGSEIEEPKLDEIALDVFTHAKVLSESDIKKYEEKWDAFDPDAEDDDEEEDDEE